MTAQLDRYISFCGIDCDIRAEKFVMRLQDMINDAATDPKWSQYFHDKLTQNQKMGHDALFFIGSQVNALYTYFEAVEDQEGLDLLWDIEQECC